jgi:hypothetical protein|tara:strand:+ start:1041 stop:2117 length:1077 start_codon:yes stop_codon:yes gene_type:complete
MASQFTVIKSPFNPGNPAPEKPEDFAVAVLRSFQSRLPSFIPLEAFIDPKTTESQVRGTTYSEKHVRDLKASIRETGLDSAIIAEEVSDDCGNVAAMIVEGNHRYKAMTELFEETGSTIPTNSGQPEIKAFVLERNFFPTKAHREAFQLYMNKPVLKKSCTPDEVINATGVLIEDGFFGDPATEAEGVIEDAAKTFIKKLYPTMSRKQVADAVVARANMSRNNRRLTNGFTANDARTHKAASRVIFDGKDRGDYIISPMVISNDNADFRKALGEVVEKLAALDASGGAEQLNVKVRLVAKTNKATDFDIDTYRSKIRAKVSDINTYATSEMGKIIIDEVLFLPEKTNEAKEYKRNRFI